MAADDFNPMLERLEKCAVALEFLHNQPPSEKRDSLITRLEMLQMRLLNRLRSSGDLLYPS